MSDPTNEIQVEAPEVSVVVPLDDDTYDYWLFPRSESYEVVQFFRKMVESDYGKNAMVVSLNGTTDAANYVNEKIS